VSFRSKDSLGYRRPLKITQHEQTSKLNSNHVESRFRSQPLPAIGQSSTWKTEHDNEPSTKIKAVQRPNHLKTNKSSVIRTQANNRKGDSAEQKPKGKLLPLNRKQAMPIKMTETSTTIVQSETHDSEPTPVDRVKRSTKKSYSVPAQRSTRRITHLTDEVTSSTDEGQRRRSESRKRSDVVSSDTYSTLPPVRLVRPAPFYGPMFDYPPVPPAQALLSARRGRSSRRRYPSHEEYPPYGPFPYPPYMPYPYPYPFPYPYDEFYQHPAYDAPHHGSYDDFFHHERRKKKSKSKLDVHEKDARTNRHDQDIMTGNETEQDYETEPDYETDRSKSKSRAKSRQRVDNNRSRQYNRHDAQRQKDEHQRLPINYDENNKSERDRIEHSTSNVKTNIHETLYAQAWKKLGDLFRLPLSQWKISFSNDDFIHLDSYQESQRRQNLRDKQGFYYPYKRYTLKDYKDLQKLAAQNNPYARVAQTSVDRVCFYRSLNSCVER
jgi:hypothetical protein